MTIDKEKIIISKQCLHEFDAKDICIILCKALKTSKNEKRSTWLVDTLQSFMTSEMSIRSMHECMKCVTRIKMKKVCNACYALAIGYSKKGVIKILAKIRNNNCHISIHGNQYH